MKHLLLQDQYLTYIQISRPIGPQQTTQTTKKGTPPPPLFNQKEHKNLMSENQFGHSIFDAATLGFNNSSLNTSKDDENISIDLEIQNQLNKHFGFSTLTTTFSSTSTVKNANSTVVSSTSAVKSVTSTTASHITKTPTMTTDSNSCTCTKTLLQMVQRVKLFP